MYFSLKASNIIPQNKGIVFETQLKLFRLYDNNNLTVQYKNMLIRNIHIFNCNDLIYIRLIILTKLN